MRASGDPWQLSDLKRDGFSLSRGSGGRKSALPQVLQVQSNCLANQFPHLARGLGNGDTSGQIWNIRAIASGPLFNDRNISHGLFFNPACRKMLASVFGGSSIEGLPAIVTVPGFLEW